jgi:membrane-bound metal-dependent hydrolase YbcI (DUF457 family)
MPSPVGHLIAGAAVGWAAEALPPLRERVHAIRDRGGAVPTVTPLVLACAALALAPDFDILLASHRTYTHSIGAAVFAAVLGAAIARYRGTAPLAVGLACGFAVGSHIVLDWLGHDGTPPFGLMALWPFTTSWVYSGADLFADVSRSYWKPEEFIFKNAVSVAREVAILAPPAALAWWVRQRPAPSP